MPCLTTPALLKAMLIAERMESERLRQIVREFQRHRFGRRAESPVRGSAAAGAGRCRVGTGVGPGRVRAEDQPSARRRAGRRRTTRGALSTHLPRVETVVDVTSTACPCCAGTLHRIGEDVSEQLAIVPAQFRVLVVRRPRYACLACTDVVVQAPAPA